MGRFNLHRYGQRGSALMGALVGAGITGIIAVALTQLMSDSMRSQKSIELRGDLESIRQAFRSGVDCPQTLSAPGITAPSDCTCADAVPPARAATCSPTAYFALRRADGSALIANGHANGTHFGNWSIRASCSPTSMIVERSRQDASGHFLKDPVTGHDSQWEPLFESGVGICTSFFGGGTTPSFTLSGRANSFYFNGQSHSVPTSVVFPRRCPNPILVTQSVRDSVLCGNGAGPIVCPNDPGTTSQDIHSYNFNVTDTGFRTFISGNNGVWVGAVSPAFGISWIAVCNPP